MSRNNVLIILGMGRSGTSFIAGWLNSCGLNLGNKLIKANWMNPKGYFEDINIQNFQERIFNRNTTSILGYQNQIIIDDNDLEEARLIINHRNEELRQWGWKHPKTNLLMECLWHRLLPKAKIILIYRPYWEVIDSINRSLENGQFRKKNKFLGFAKYLFYRSKLAEQYRNNGYLKVWIQHNQKALSYLKANKKTEEYIVLSANNLLIDSTEIFQKLTEVMGFELDYIDPKIFFEKQLFKHTDVNKLKFNSELKMIANELMNQLSELRLIKS